MRRPESNGRLLVGRRVMMRNVEVPCESSYSSTLDQSQLEPSSINSPIRGRHLHARHGASTSDSCRTAAARKLRGVPRSEQAHVGSSADRRFFVWKDRAEGRLRLPKVFPSRAYLERSPFPTMGSLHWTGAAQIAPLRWPYVRALRCSGTQSFHLAHLREANDAGGHRVVAFVGAAQHPAVTKLHPEQ